MPESVYPAFRMFELRYSEAECTENVLAANLSADPVGEFELFVRCAEPVRVTDGSWTLVGRVALCSCVYSVIVYSKDSRCSSTIS